MNKKYFYFLIPAIIAVLVYIIGGFTGMLKIYKAGSPSMEPGYADGAYLIVSNIIHPDYNDVICFESITYGIPGIREEKTELKVGRLIGMGRDKIELKDGICYRNGKMVDIESNLKFAYQASAGLFEKSTIKQTLKKSDFFSSPYLEQVILFLGQDTYEKYKDELQLEKMNMPFGIGLETSPIRDQIAPEWTWANYGPVEVPEGHFFYLGDNRMNAEDSRVVGSLPMSDIKGVVIN